jgi:propionyl-CoA carboxylase alpha chain
MPAPKTPIMFEKVLIANRGEIALRIMRTLKKMGIKSVAVYSEADTNSLHVQYADEAIYIGPSPANESYLSIPNLMAAINKSGAQGVHPGYGFLSENALFAKSLKDEGIVLIGPSVNAIKLMGDKIEAKKIALQANVNTVPGYMGVIETPEEAVKIAANIGFPVMLKAAAGGGGRGMRVVRSEHEMLEAFASASNEAQNNFSDGRVFLEKFIENPRHIEIQLLADNYGNAICLGERECSIQRHHQKVIEEAPSPFVDEETRLKMYEQVRSLAKIVKYSSAGTVEFIVDQNKNFYFLEMNTRLQVEHCVTELITGVDIVEQMIRIAIGEKLSFKQEDVKLNGWAMESRIYAEDPSRGFLPSSGRITQYSEPPKDPSIRIDSGVSEGGEVSMFYDAMIAKICSYGEDRNQAIKIMQAALGDFVIRGIAHNISFLEAVMSNEVFISGNISTNFIEQQYPSGFSGAELTSEISKIFLAVSVFIFFCDAKRAALISGRLPGKEKQIGTRWVVNVDNVYYPILLKSVVDGFYIRHNGERIYIISKWNLGNKLFRGSVNDKAVSVKIEEFAGGYYLTHAGITVKTTVRSPRVAELERFMPTNDHALQSNALEAPLSGLVSQVRAAVGDKIKAGQELVVIEAMKMENIICAEKDCEISAIHVNKNDNVIAGQVIIEFA